MAPLFVHSYKWLNCWARQPYGMAGKLLEIEASNRGFVVGNF